MGLHRWLVDLLARLAKDEDRYVMGYAAQALRCLAEAGSAMASRSLYEALIDSAVPEDSETRQNARRDLEILNSHHALQDPLAEERRLARLAMLVDRFKCPRTDRASPY